MEKETTQPADSPESNDGGGAAPQETQAGEAQTDAAQELPIEERLKKAEEETQRYLDNWRRAEADLQNVKRRAEQDRTESARYAGASLIINILPIVDDFERAFQSLDSHVAGMTWFDGVRLIYRKLLALLESAGVQPLKTDGETVEPQFPGGGARGGGDGDEGVREGRRGHRTRLSRAVQVIPGAERWALSNGLSVCRT